MNERYTDKRLGKTISQLRQEKHLTQKNLCGTFISRNMLSLIESGNSLPSLQTLLFLCEQLETEPNVLLASENEEKIIKDNQYINTLLRLLTNKNYEEALILSKEYISTNIIARKIFFDSAEKLADESRNQMFLSTSEKYYKMIIEHRNFCDRFEVLEKAEYFVVLINSFHSRVDDSKLNKLFTYHASYSFFHTLNQILDFGYIDSMQILSLGIPKAYEDYLMAQNYFSAGKNDNSIDLLQQLITNNRNDFFLLYSSYSLLVTIYQEKEDYKQAYIYSKKINDLNIQFIK